jgi:hypothetical protein
MDETKAVLTLFESAESRRRIVSAATGVALAGRFGVVNVAAFTVNESPAASPMVAFPLTERFPPQVTAPVVVRLPAEAEPSADVDVGVMVGDETPPLNVAGWAKETLELNWAEPLNVAKPPTVSVPDRLLEPATSFWTKARHVNVCDVDRFPPNDPVAVKTHAPVTFSVPATAVFPLAAATVNRVVATAKLPAKESVPPTTVFPLAAATVNVEAPTAKLPVEVSVPENVDAPPAAPRVNAASLPRPSDNSFDVVSARLSPVFRMAGYVDPACVPVRVVPMATWRGRARCW